METVVLENGCEIAFIMPLIDRKSRNWSYDFKKWLAEDAEFNTAEPSYISTLVSDLTNIGIHVPNFQPLQTNISGVPKMLNADEARIGRSSTETGGD